MYTIVNFIMSLFKGNKKQKKGTKEEEGRWTEEALQQAKMKAMLNDQGFVELKEF